LLPEKSLINHLRQEELNEDELERRIDETVDLVSQAISDLATKFGKPIIGFTFRGLEEKIVKGIIKRGIPVFPDPKRAAKAINAMVRYYDNTLIRSALTTGALPV
jgi:acyl-CoA synthetase (NDP forming)